jgi:hypothetical protein
VRFYGINFGLPHTHCRPDEETIIMVALKFFSGDLNPHFFNYPTLYMYILFGLYCCYLLIHIVLGGTVPEFLTEIAIQPDLFYLISRSLSALLGAFTMIIVFFIAKSVFDKKTAFVSSFFISITYLHVRNSHFGTTDIAMTFFITCATLYIIKAAREKKRMDYILSGVFTGLATATKYGGMFLIFSMFLAHIMNHLQRVFKQQKILSDKKTGRFKPSVAACCQSILLSAKEKYLWLYAGVATVSFFLASPFILLDFKTFLKGFLFEVRHVADVQGVITTRGWWYHIRYTLPYGMGWGMFLTSLAGVVLYVRKDMYRALILYAFPVAFFIVAGKGYTVHLRYMVPILPFLCIASAMFVVQVNTILFRASLRKYMLPVWAFLLAIPSSHNGIRFDYLMAKVDNRVIAADWIQNNIPSGSSIYRSGSLYGQVRLRLSEKSLEEQYREVIANGGTGRLIRIKLRHSKENENQKGFYDWKYDANVPISESVDLPDFIIIQRSPLASYSKIPSQITRLVEKQYHLIKSFEAIDMSSSYHWYNQLDAFYLPFVGFKAINRPGPNLYIYKYTGTHKN